MEIVVSVSRQLFRIPAGKWQPENLLVAGDVGVISDPLSIRRYRPELYGLIACRDRPCRICAGDRVALVTRCPDVGDGSEYAVGQRLPILADRDRVRVESRRDPHGRPIRSQVALEALKIDVTRAAHVRHIEQRPVSSPYR